MFLYNITFLVDEPAEKQWLDELKNNYIPTVLETGFFQSYQLLQVLDSPNEGSTYCLQFRTNEISSLQSYQSLYAPQIESNHQQIFVNQLVTFTSTMKIIDEQ
ncbi:DUF4286 family protein [Mucilaginibacter sp.]|uniref:DUF4286 family protein n=1 Tax=Mucilaginibacter sp. TaxID=1882438 RepID=UPI003B003BB7